MKLRPDDTIAAIATPLGEGAISVVRMTGPKAIEVADVVFRGGRRVGEMGGHTVRHGKIIDPFNEPIDDVLVTVFREPHSYTGENLVEFSCHGGIQVTRSVLETILHSGARLADPGEFTKRAFLNGKMDLSQAEAVADLISAKSRKAQRSSVVQLDGGLSKRVREIKARLLSLCSLLEIDLDLSEEGISVAPRKSIIDELTSISHELEKLIDSYDFGRIIRNGVSVAIIGKPNAGKSSLFNALLHEDRSIVSPTPGTTRDFLEEEIVISGILFKLMDTAGLREASDSVEAEGVTRTLREMSNSDSVLFVVDSTVDDGQGNLFGEVSKKLRPEQRLLVALTKCDVATASHLRFSSDLGVDALRISAVTGVGLEDLRNKLVHSILVDNSSAKTDIEITSARHVEILRNTLASILDAEASLRSNVTYDFVALDIRGSLDYLAEITGEITSDDILNRIFSEFCVGK
ncbi:MAG TPA: tRNA uridine-5-carboxymethylaminomethyl(34) synthesis GTPase MnmE [Bacteroidota bacterium]|nr:tRNA uridine-5-carboxymethylaminomethyl(34) synthesis GTPase MnmE [Bacteroidota bacterium]